MGKIVFMTTIAIENVSDTALWVAAYRAIESERRDALYQDPLAGKLAGERGREIARSMPYGEVTGWIMVVRTIAIDRLIFEALEDGVDTVVNLGAGLDTRPYRLNLPAALKWIEIDFPHLIQMKNEKLVGEKPKCELTRIGLDLSKRSEANRVYAEIGSQAGRVLILTEGVVPYLSNAQAADLAEDLRKVPNFHYWIQDYQKSGLWNRPAKLKKKLAKAPMKFQHPDPLDFFLSHGWEVKHNILAVEEGERVGRKFPIPFPWGYLAIFAPRAKKQAFRGAAGYVLFMAHR